MKSLILISTLLLLTTSLISGDGHDSDEKIPEMASPLPPGPKEGYCPPVAQGCSDDRTPDPIQCTYDHHCNGSDKCCGTSCFGRVCMQADGVREGTCPDYRAMFISCGGTRTIEKCSVDFDCSWGKKCCDSPCGQKECFTAGDPPKPVVDKQGQCPMHPMIACRINDTSTQNVTNCGSDSQCADDLKCCSTACSGMTCQLPVYPPPPVDPFEKPGTCRVHIMMCRVNDTNINGTAKNNCTSDNQCEGDLKCCSTPCSGMTCQTPDFPPPPVEPVTENPPSCPVFFGGCLKPNQTNDPIQCDSDLDCLPDQKCCDTACKGKKCYTTALVNKQGECPMQPMIACRTNDTNTQNVFNCGADIDCAGGLKCCSTPCSGMTCQYPVYPPPLVDPFEKPGTCRMHIMMCRVNDTNVNGTAKNNCTSDRECDGYLKCCSTPCSGMTCQTPDFPPPPVIENPGSCPVFFAGCLNPNQTSDPIECNNDLDCDPNQKCCDTACKGKKCYTTGPVKAGECEDPKREVSLCLAGVYANSTAECSHDGQCPGNEKCCPQTCVKPRCNPPIKKVLKSGEKPGLCQDWTGIMATCIAGGYENSTAQCTNDGDCTGDEKCCPQLCVKPLCRAPLVEKHAGQCPSFTGPADLSKRKFTCKDDYDCALSEKCCATSDLGLQCLPANYPPAGSTAPRAGSCPSNLAPSDDIYCTADYCTNDQDCGYLEKCCLNTCGKKQCSEPATPQVCPVYNRTATCGVKSAEKRNAYECNPRSSGCADGSRCCDYECSGTHCVADLCEAPNKNIMCFMAEKRECETSSQCKADQICCEIYCGGTRCKNITSNNVNSILVTEKPLCGPVCEIFCPYGHQRGPDGCELCPCNPSPCMNFQCSAGYHCNVTQCDKTPCPDATAACVPDTPVPGCPQLMCPQYCQYGHKLNANGCHTCACNEQDPCMTVKCSSGYHCEPKQVQCITAPCPAASGQCVADTKACPDLVCTLYCQFGHVLDVNGCRTCACKENPCSTIRCAAGYHCATAQPRDCVPAPCPAVTGCVPDSNCTDLMCDVSCEYGHTYNEQGCETCQCYEPCKDKSCPTGQVCKAKQVTCVKAPCYPVAECVNDCPNLPCDVYCEHGHVYDKNNCPTCECYDPCKNNPCTPGQVCKAQQVNCVTAPCYPVGQCVSAAAPMVPQMVCPEPEKSCPTGQRRVKCTDDSGCGDKKCCSTGCGYNICLPPVRAGKCPVYDLALIDCKASEPGDEQDLCGTDVVCSGVQRCCPSSCPGFGKSCMDPV